MVCGFVCLWLLDGWFVFGRYWFCDSLLGCLLLCGSDFSCLREFGLLVMCYWFAFMFSLFRVCLGDVLLFYMLTWVCLVCCICLCVTLVVFCWLFCDCLVVGGIVVGCFPCYLFGLWLDIVCCLFCLFWFSVHC